MDIRYHHISQSEFVEALRINLASSHPQILLMALVKPWWDIGYNRKHIVSVSSNQTLNIINVAGTCNPKKATDQPSITLDSDQVDQQSDCKLLNGRGREAEGN